MLCMEALELALLVPVLLAAGLLLARELGSPACTCMFGAMTYTENNWFSVSTKYSLYTQEVISNIENTPSVHIGKSAEETVLCRYGPITNYIYACYTYLLAELHPVALVKLQYLVVKGDIQYKTCIYTVM